MSRLAVPSPKSSGTEPAGVGVRSGRVARRCGSACRPGPQLMTIFNAPLTRSSQLRARLRAINRAEECQRTTDWTFAPVECISHRGIRVTANENGVNRLMIADPTNPEASPGSTPSARAIVVLVVDDDAAFRAGLHEALESRG